MNIGLTYGQIATPNENDPMQIAADLAAYGFRLSTVGDTTTLDTAAVLQQINHFVAANDIDQVYLPVLAPDMQDA